MSPSPGSPLTSVALLLLAGGLSGCARSLREPPSLADLDGGGYRPLPAAADSLLIEAEALYATRSLEKVRKAAAFWLEAARADPARTEGLVGMARAQVWLVDHETDPAARRAAATAAVRAAQWCERIARDDPACAYWLGAALGMQARERPSTGLDALPRIEQAFKRAAANKPNLEDGGPDRALALLYLRAPGWPTGPGDPDRGMEHARRAVDLSPDYPPNQLALAEALAATGERAGAGETYRHALGLARERASTGDPDAEEWIREAQKALSSLSGG